ncbi:acetylcholinesterase isoform E4-E6 precursor [Oopsacas minuta]|uniref:Acetylcholinesterase isoform E4-E6 n=1 Tax=Oopsacas minuta TaxID=111878 RepID=A0AAV7KDF1_9METZ|nr:acetylcholinesterase isoform E4-E6 precursor [Oopsacas minuta]
MTVLLLLLVISAVFQTVCDDRDDSITVNLPFGSITGYSNGESWEFYRIPYTDPPVGKLRWRPPKDFTPWTGNLDAKDPPPGCPQDCMTEPYACPTETSEDCLYLNIFTPLKWTQDPQESYDVLVYIHGGAYFQGSASCPLLDSRFLSNHTDTIVVTLNYRLGALGFLKNFWHGIDGNMGIQDQRMAMQWVKKYISYFGGKGKITLFGESSGAMSVAVHMVSPLSKGLYDYVIMESNGWTLPYRSSGDAELLGYQFIWRLGCVTIHCMQTKSTNKILKAQEMKIAVTDSLNLLMEVMPWSPIIDGVQLTQQPFVALMDMVSNKTLLPPQIVGTTTNEGFGFVKFVQRKLEIEQEYLYMIILFGLFKFKSGDVEKLYNDLYKPPRTNPEYIQRLSMIVGDYLFICPTRQYVRTVSEGDLIWSYIWSKPITYISKKNACYNFACHTAELPYVFGTVSLWGRQFSQEDKGLSEQTQAYWGNFAHAGSPNSGTSELQWPAYNTGEASQMYFDTPNPSVTNNYKNKVCEMLDGIGYNRGEVFEDNYAENIPVHETENKPRKEEL